MLQQLIAAGAVAIAAPALVLEELRERDLMDFIRRRTELAAKMVQQSFEDWIMYGSGPIADEARPEYTLRGLEDKPLAPGFMELIAARLDRRDT
jgi:hypothetical protein